MFLSASLSLPKLKFLSFTLHMSFMSFTYSASEYLAFTTFKKCNDPKREEQKRRAKTAFDYESFTTLEARLHYLQ